MRMRRAKDRRPINVTIDGRQCDPERGSQSGKENERCRDLPSKLRSVIAAMRLSHGVYKPVAEAEVSKAEHGRNGDDSREDAEPRGAEVVQRQRNNDQHCAEVRAARKSHRYRAKKCPVVSSPGTVVLAEIASQRVSR